MGLSRFEHFFPVIRILYTHTFFNVSLLLHYMPKKSKSWRNTPPLCSNAYARKRPRNLQSHTRPIWCAKTTTTLTRTSILCFVVAFVVKMPTAKKKRKSQKQSPQWKAFDGCTVGVYQRALSTVSSGRHRWVSVGMYQRALSTV